MTDNYATFCTDGSVNLCAAAPVIGTSQVTCSVVVGGGTGKRCERFTADNIKPRLNMRDFIATMRTRGLQFAGPPRMNIQDKLQFVNPLDRWLKSRPDIRLAGGQENG